MGCRNGALTRVAIGLGGLWWSARRAKTGTVTPTEERIFRAFNDTSDRVEGKVWLVMQSGSFPAIPVAATVIGLSRGRQTGQLVGVAGTVAWLSAKAVKQHVGRGRPADHLAGVRIRGRAQTGLGYPSGHAAVALTLARTGVPDPPWRSVAALVAGVAAGGRLYSGAHLPLDVVGGLALGTFVEAVVDLVHSRSYTPTP